MCLVQVTACLFSELAADSRAHDEIQGNVQIQRRHRSERASDLGIQRKSQGFQSDAHLGAMKLLI